MPRVELGHDSAAVSKKSPKFCSACGARVPLPPLPETCDCGKALRFSFESSTHMFRTNLRSRIWRQLTKGKARALVPLIQSCFPQQVFIQEFLQYEGHGVFNTREISKNREGCVMREVNTLTVHDMVVLEKICAFEYFDTARGFAAGCLAEKGDVTVLAPPITFEHKCLRSGEQRLTVLVNTVLITCGQDSELLVQCHRAHPFDELIAENHLGALVDDYPARMRSAGLPVPPSLIDVDHETFYQAWPHYGVKALVAPPLEKRSVAASLNPTKFLSYEAKEEARSKRLAQSKLQAEAQAAEQAFAAQFPEIAERELTVLNMTGDMQRRFPTVHNPMEGLWQEFETWKAQFLAQKRAELAESGSGKLVSSGSKKAKQKQSKSLTVYKGYRVKEWRPKSKKPKF